MHFPPSHRSPSPIRILIADDHPLFRRGLVEVFSKEEDFAVTAEVGDGPTLLAGIRDSRPDLILLDLRLADRDGLDLIPEILERAPGIRILVLTVSESPEDRSRALRSGASGYFLKGVDPVDLVKAIRKIRFGEPIVRRSLRGGHPLPPEKDQEPKAEAGFHPPLSGRELEVLRKMAEGRLNKEIAKLLNISEFTVKNHVKSILVKLGASNRTQAVTQAFQAGLLPRGGPPEFS